MNPVQPSTSIRPVAAPIQAASVAAAPALKSPDWVKDAVFYQVFPERFRNGDPGNDPAGTVPWGSPPKNDQFFMGGDLDGITGKMGYLAKLGVNALYLNPIFQSPSNHKYDTTDYMKIDAAFGGDSAFDRLTAGAHAHGVKLVLDGSFNHTSNEHVWFKDVREKGSASPYWSWYNVHRHPIQTWRDDKGVLRTSDYEGWGKPEWGGPYATLPVLRNTKPEVMDAIVTGRDSVLRHWIKGGKIDGWRMDVADEVEPEVWREARKVIKSEDPDAYLLGENWHDASDMLRGDQFDGVMNYKHFQQPAVEFFAKKGIRPDEFAARLRSPYSREAKLAMMNILDSHDTPRFISQSGGDWYRLRPAAIFQMTYQGAPSIYYGSEIGMEGGADPENRRAMDWNIADNIAPTLKLDGDQQRGVAAPERANQLFGLYQKLIETRTGTEALRRGDFQVLSTHNDDNTIAYRRWIDGDARDAVVALNNNVVDRDMVIPVRDFAKDGSAFVDALTGTRHVVKDGRIELERLDGNWGAVLLREPAPTSA